MPYHTAPHSHPADAEADIYSGELTVGPGSNCAEVRFKDGTILHAPPGVSPIDRVANARACIEGRLAWEDHRLAVLENWGRLTERAKDLRDAMHQMGRGTAIAAQRPLRVGELTGKDAAMELRAQAYSSAGLLAWAVSEGGDLLEDFRADRRAAAIWGDEITAWWALAVLDAACELHQASAALGDNFAIFDVPSAFHRTLAEIKAAVEHGHPDEAKRIWAAAEKPKFDAEMPGYATNLPAWGRTRARRRASDL